MVRSQLDYCSSVWTPYRKSDIEALEKMQKKATKILPHKSQGPFSGGVQLAVDLLDIILNYIILQVVQRTHTQRTPRPTCRRHFH